MSTDPLRHEIERLRDATGYTQNRFWKLWAKLELILGLTSSVIGLFLGMVIASTPAGEITITDWLPASTLFVLGSYLALAGHRSHLYQSNIRLVAYLAVVIRQQHPPGDCS